MNNLAIIDIGSNSIRMIVVEVSADGTYRLIEEVKEGVRLGDKMNGGGSIIRADRMDYAIKTLRFFLDLKQALLVDKVICVATEAVRRAKNRTEFLDAVRDQLGLEVHVLTGTEEAYLDYVGASNTLILPDCLIADIGGSSTELVRVTGNVISNAECIPIGAINVSQRFHLEYAASGETVEELRRYVREKFAGLQWIYGVETLVGIGGSFRNLARIDQKKRNYPLDIVHNYTMQPQNAREISSAVLSMPEKERRKLKGISKDRADILPGALTIVTTLLDLTQSSSIIVSGAGLRDGLLYDWLLRDAEPIEDVFGHSVRNAIQRLGINRGHAEHVWSITKQLYDQLRDELGIKGSPKVLKAASLLHDCGINISYYDHQRHSFYEILNSHLNGMSHKEILMTAWVASMHRKGAMKLTSPFRSLLTDEDVLAAHQLGVLLHIAECLDRRQNGNIYRVLCDATQSFVKIGVAAKVSPELEIRYAQIALPRFSKVFRRQLAFEVMA